MSMHPETVGNIARPHSFPRNVGSTALLVLATLAFLIANVFVIAPLRLVAIP